MNATVDISDIASATDIAHLLGVANSTVSNWLHRSHKGRSKSETFPQPFTHINNGHTPLYRKSEVIAWYRSTISPELLEALLKGST